MCPHAPEFQLSSLSVKRDRMVTGELPDRTTPLGGLTGQQKARTRRALFRVAGDYAALRRFAAAHYRSGPARVLRERLIARID